MFRETASGGGGGTRLGDARRSVLQVLRERDPRFADVAMLYWHSPAVQNGMRTITLLDAENRAPLIIEQSVNGRLVRPLTYVRQIDLSSGASIRGVHASAAGWLGGVWGVGTSASSSLSRP